MTRLVFILSVLLLTSCSLVNVKTRFEHSVDIAQYKTWCWLEGCELDYQGPGYLDDSAMIEMIGNAVAVEMQRKGYVQAGDQADLLVDFHMVVKEDSAKFARVHEEDLPFWNDYHHDDYYYFLKGALIIDVGVRSTGRMIWRSTSRRSMALSPDISPAEVRKSVRKAMKKLPRRKT